MGRAGSTGVPYEAHRIAASGFLLKDAPPDRLLDAVRAAAAGDALPAPSITRRLIQQFARAARPRPGTVPARAGPAHLREEVLRLLAGGLSNAEIAAELVRTRSRHTSPNCSVSSACATGYRRSWSPTRQGSWPRARARRQRPGS